MEEGSRISTAKSYEATEFTFVDWYEELKDVDESINDNSINRKK